MDALSPGRTRKRKLTRAEKADENRRALFRAAAEVVGKHGYKGASIGRIKALATRLVMRYSLSIQCLATGESK